MKRGFLYILIDMRCKQDGINLSIDNRQVGEREREREDSDGPKRAHL